MDVPSHYRDGVGIDTDTSSNRPHREAVDVENTRTSSAPNLLKVCTYTPCVLVSRSLRRTDIFEELLINLGVISGRRSISYYATYFSQLFISEYMRDSCETLLMSQIYWRG